MILGSAGGRIARWNTDALDLLIDCTLSRPVMLLMEFTRCNIGSISRSLL